MLKDKERNKKRLQAYTLTEVLVTMAVSSILIIIGYTVYIMMGTYFGRVSTNGELFGERLGFRTVFSSDLDEADSVIFAEEVLVMYTGGDKLEWLFGDGGIIRKGDAEIVYGTGKCNVETSAINEGRGRHRRNLISSVAVNWEGSANDSASFRFLKEYPINTFIND